MKKLFIVAAFAGLMSCGHDDCCEQSIVIKGKQCDFTQDSTVFVSDSVFMNNKAYIDSLTDVNELLDYLETIPSTHR